MNSKKSQLVIANGGPEHIGSAWAIIEGTIPIDERRSWEQQRDVMNDARYRFQSFLVNSDVVAAVGSWQFERFLFIEHIAVDPKSGGQGLGTIILKGICEKSPLPVLVEVELPEAGDLAFRRIGWYQRLGFEVNIPDYMQPPYSSEKRPVPMKLLSYPCAISLAECNDLINVLYSEVYKIKSA